MNLLPLLCVLLPTAGAMRPSSGMLRCIPSCGTLCARRGPVVLARSEEERENMMKWGAILQEADTFDDEYLKKQGRRRTVTPSEIAAAKRSELIIAGVSAAILLGMLAAVVV